MNRHHRLMGPRHPWKTQWPWLLLALAFGSCSGGPSVTTGASTPLGLGALSLNGSIHPEGIYTTYYFEYGTTDSYGSRTEEAPLPPRLAAYYRETWDEGTGGWGSWEQPEIPHSSGGVSGGYIEWKEPAARNDFNHVMADILHLTTFLRTGLLGQWQEEGNSVWGGGDPDLRGARVSIWVRGNDWEPRGSELIWWLQSQSNQELQNNLGWRRANWAYNGHNLTEYLLNGEWHHAQYRLRNNTNLWTYGGRNIGQGTKAKRYEYWPIDRSLGHVNNNFFHLLAFVDPHDLPVGSIDFDEFELVYRNRSLLLPSNGGTLAAWPSDSDQDPTTLTDGWRHGEGKMWHSGGNPARPLELFYEFENPVTVRSVQLHQNPSWPARQVEVAKSLDGKSYAPLFEATLPRRGEPNDNFAFHLEKGSLVGGGARDRSFRPEAEGTATNSSSSLNGIGRRRVRGGYRQLRVVVGRAGWTMILPDVNVLLHAFRPDSTDHARARNWLG